MSEFKILTPREHVRTRIGMYLGSSSREEIQRFVIGKWKKISYVPAIIKMIDEILDNAVDEAVRTNFKYANEINVTINQNLISITDNGRGIPQDFILDTVTNEKILRPVAAWTRVNAGTSFHENRVTIGTNGVGSSATNFLSSFFEGRTWSNGKECIVSCRNGAEQIEVYFAQKSGSGTSVSFSPDFSLFNDIDNLQEFEIEELVKDRLINLSISFPEITFFLNKKKIQTKKIHEYSSFFLENENSSVFCETTENVSFFFTSSADGFRSNSFINGVNTRLGGMYVDYIVYNVVDHLSDLIRKKYKIEIPKSTIKNGFTFVLFVRNFEDPKFDSQTKERLTSSLSSVKSHYEKSKAKDFLSIAKKIFSFEDLIQPIVAASIAKKEAEDLKNSILNSKKIKKMKVAKHIAATSKDATLFLCEGDSAIASFIEVRNPKTSGAYPLRGVVMNTWELKASEVLKNKELSEMISILNLDINDPNSVDFMSYKNIATLTDADHDGQHISTLLIAFFYKFWPRLFHEKRVHITKSPVLISKKQSDVRWFYDYKTAQEFKENSDGYHHRYIKGLGSLTVQEYSQIINSPVFYTIIPDNVSYIEMMFGSNSELRKKFMTEEQNG